MECGVCTLRGDGEIEQILYYGGDADWNQKGGKVVGWNNCGEILKFCLHSAQSNIFESHVVELPLIEYTYRAFFNFIKRIFIMFQRFALNISPEILAKTFDLLEIPQIESRYNIAPGQVITIVRRIGGQNKLDFIAWGLSQNALEDCVHAPAAVCSETVHENPTFAHAIKYNRCIIPASGFYELLPNDNQKQPYYFRMNSSVVGFAGLWEKWLAEDGSETETCSILTTTSNELIRPINDRMPVVLQSSDYSLWLNGNVCDPNELQRVYLPYPSDLMVAFQVPDLVKNLRFDSAACIIQM